MDLPVSLTRPQAVALSALRSADRPLSAYDVLDVIRKDRPTAAAPTAYRALSRLVELGLAHRLESINAYVACVEDHEDAAAFSICDACGNVDEIADPLIAAEVVQLARRGGFAPTRSVIELHGRCAGCREESR